LQAIPAISLDDLPPERPPQPKAGVHLAGELHQAEVPLQLDGHGLVPRIHRAPHRRRRAAPAEGVDDHGAGAQPAPFQHRVEDLPRQGERHFRRVRRRGTHEQEIIPGS
jgi:hypothetical protein